MLVIAILRVLASTVVSAVDHLQRIRHVEMRVKQYAVKTELKHIITTHDRIPRALYDMGFKHS